MTDIFHEIEEDLRRERLSKLWDRFGGYIIALAVLVVLATAGWSAYKYWRHEQAVAASTGFQDALDLAEKGEHQQAEAAFDAVSRSGPAGYKAIARLRAASEAALRDRAAGISAFDAIAADSGLDGFSRDMAKVRAGQLAVDTASLDDIRARIGDLAAGTGPLRNPAREILALAQLKAGDLAGAHATASAITEDMEATPGVRSRADLIQRLTQSAVAAKLPATPGAPAAAGTPVTQ